MFVLISSLCLFWRFVETLLLCFLVFYLLLISLLFSLFAFLGCNNTKKIQLFSVQITAIGTLVAVIATILLFICLFAFHLGIMLQRKCSFVP